MNNFHVIKFARTSIFTYAHYVCDEHTTGTTSSRAKIRLMCISCPGRPTLRLSQWKSHIRAHTYTNSTYVLPPHSNLNYVSAWDDFPMPIFGFIKGCCAFVFAEHTEWCIGCSYERTVAKHTHNHRNIDGSWCDFANHVMFFKSALIFTSNHLAKWFWWPREITRDLICTYRIIQGCILLFSTLSSSGAELTT